MSYARRPPQRGEDAEERNVNDAFQNAQLALALAKNGAETLRYFRAHCAVRAFRRRRRRSQYEADFADELRRLEQLDGALRVQLARRPGDLVARECLIRVRADIEHIHAWFAAHCDRTHGADTRCDDDTCDCRDGDTPRGPLAHGRDAIEAFRELCHDIDCPCHDPVWGAGETREATGFRQTRPEAGDAQRFAAALKIADPAARVDAIMRISVDSWPLGSVLDRITGRRVDPFALLTDDGCALLRRAIADRRNALVLHRPAFTREIICAAVNRLWTLDKTIKNDVRDNVLPLFWKKGPVAFFYDDAYPVLLRPK